uniref:Acyl-CoA dehydrogenase/oxidase C-terminal domain-containing protein n=2 Tax=Meloidogyne TaxID=189290 RepID=A0A914LZE6_MELIC
MNSLVPVEYGKKLKNKAKQFSKQTILPKAVEYDTKVEFPSKIIKQVHSRGLMNSLVPVEYELDDCSTVCTINLEDVVVYSSNVISVPREGFNVAMKTFEKTRPVFAALSIGLTSCVLDEVVKSMRAIPLPVSNDQLYEFVIADLVLKNELARNINLKVSQEFDRCPYTAYWASLAKSISFDTANEALNWLDVWKNFLNGSDLDNKLQIEKLSGDLKLFEQTHYVKMIEPSTIALRFEKAEFGINFPFRLRLIFHNAKELLNMAKNYYVFGYYINATDKICEAYVATVKYFYKDVNSIFIGSHGGIGTWLSLKRLVKRSKLFFDFYWIVLFSFFLSQLFI